MIKTERQYRITRSQVERFQHVLEELQARPTKVGDPLRRQFEMAAVEAQVRELTDQLVEYERLKAGDLEVGPLPSVEELPKVLIRARIAAGLTQRDLAERLGLAEQQVQRYEANDWRTASLDRLIHVAKALGLTSDSESPLSLDPVRPQSVRHQLTRAGIDDNFVRRRLASPYAGGDSGGVFDLASKLNRIYGWAPSEILGGQPLEVNVPSIVGFKLPAGANAKRFAAYTVYAHYVALLALDATPTLARSEIPDSASVFRAAVQDRFGEVTFESILNFAWELGLVVLPLSDPGAFHAAVWKDRGRHAIILKQQTRTSSRWAFDLLHEINHAKDDVSEDHPCIDDEIVSGEEAELRANRFAGNVLLNGRAEELTDQCVREARHRLQALKSVVPGVAACHGVRIGDLANYLAFRLSLQGQNWWGAAMNLQDRSTDPWQIARDLFLGHADLTALNPIDRGLILQALTE